MSIFSCLRLRKAPLGGVAPDPNKNSHKRPSDAGAINFRERERKKKEISCLSKLVGIKILFVQERERESKFKKNVYEVRVGPEEYSGLRQTEAEQCAVLGHGDAQGLALARGELLFCKRVDV